MQSLEQITKASSVYNRLRVMELCELSENSA